MSYPLKPSVLAKALADAGITLDVSLYQWRKRWSNRRPKLEAYFPDGERLKVTIYAVPSAEAHAIRERMENQIIPELILWIQDYLSLPPNSTLRRGFFREL